MALISRAITLLLGIVVFSAGFGLTRLTAARAPGLAADAAAYRADPACSAPMSPAVASGSACTFADATVVHIDYGNTGTNTTPGRRPRVAIAVSGGPTASVEPTDQSFVNAIAVGGPVRVQLFNGTIARVATASATTDTTANPLYAERANPILSIAGYVMIAVGLFIGFRAIVPGRRRFGR